MEPPSFAPSPGCSRMTNFSQRCFGISSLSSEFLPEFSENLFTKVLCIPPKIRSSLSNSFRCISENFICSFSENSFHYSFWNFFRCFSGNFKSRFLRNSEIFNEALPEILSFLGFFFRLPAENSSDVPSFLPSSWLNSFWSFFRNLFRS